MLSFIYRERRALPRLTAPSSAQLVFWLGALGFIGLVASDDMMGQISWWDMTLQPVAIAATFGAITFGLLFGGGPSRVFGSVFLLFFARISYCLYLVHLPLIPLAKVLTLQSEPATPNYLLFFATFTMLSILAALLLHYSVEKPFLRFKDRIR